MSKKKIFSYLIAFIGVLYFTPLKPSIALASASSPESLFFSSQGMKIEEKPLKEEVTTRGKFKRNREPKISTPYKRKKELLRKTRTPHTIDAQPTGFLFARTLPKYYPLQQEAKGFLDSQGIASDQALSSFFLRDCQLINSRGKPLLMSFPGEFKSDFSFFKDGSLTLQGLAFFDKVYCQTQASSIRMKVGVHGSIVYDIGRAYHSALKKPAEIKRAWKESEHPISIKLKKSSLFYDGGNTFWMKNQAGKLKFLIGEYLFKYNQLWLEDLLGEKVSESLLLTFIAHDLKIKRTDIIVLPQLDYHLDFFLIPGPEGSVLLDDPKVGEGILLTGRDVEIIPTALEGDQQLERLCLAELTGVRRDSRVNSLRGVIQSFNTKTQQYNIAIKNLRGRAPICRSFPRAFFRVYDSHESLREKTQALLVENRFKVVPTPMSFPDLFQAGKKKYLTNPLYGKNISGDYFYLLLGEPLRQRSWAEYVKRTAFPGQKVFIHFVTGPIKARGKCLAQEYLDEFSAGLHCMTKDFIPQ